MGYKLISAKVDGSDITPQMLVEESLGKCGARYEEARGMVVLDHVCKVCVSSREVE